jgi:DNA-binding PadR family transcriptional regulator
MTAKIGMFEAQVLMAVRDHEGDGYSVVIRRSLSNSTHRDISYGAIYTTLDRLEHLKGLVQSRVGGATSTRGGRSKRFYSITGEGEQALSDFNNKVQEITKFLRLEVIA